MRNKALVILGVFFLLAGVVSAEWVSFDNTRSGEQAFEMNVLSSDYRGITFTVRANGVYRKFVKVDGKTYTVLGMPNAKTIMKKGYPELPQMSRLFKIDDMSNVKFEIVKKEEHTLKLNHPVLPSKGHFTRDISPESVEYVEGPVYGQDVFWPKAEDQLSSGSPFIFRDVRGVRFFIAPVSVNHVKMQAKIIKEMVVSVSFEGRGENMLFSSRNAETTRTFHNLYNSGFANYETNSRSSAPSADNRNLLVVVPSSYMSSVSNWVNWKKQSGYKVEVHEVSDGVTASQIKAVVQDRFDNDGLGYLVLVGDASYTYNFEEAKPMPTFKGAYEGAAADREYAMLKGNDNYQDIFVSRFSGNESEVKVQADKIVQYESRPLVGPWMMNGLFVASNEGSPHRDYDRANWLVNGGSQDQYVSVISGGLKKIGLGQDFTEYAPNASSTGVTNAVNEGIGSAYYIGHGSSTRWVTSGFSTSHIANLNNGRKLPIIWSVACVNGDFLKTSNCFAEAWLRKENGGAAGVEAASTNEAWVPPCDKQSATVNGYIENKVHTFGALEAKGCVAALTHWGDTDRSRGNQLAEQCNLFGDAAMRVWTRTATNIDASVTRGLGSLNFQVSSEGRSDVKAVVTVFNEDMSFTQSNEVDEAGITSVSIDSAEGTLYYTIVGPNLVPVVKQLVK